MDCQLPPFWRNYILYNSICCASLDFSASHQSLTGKPSLFDWQILSFANHPWPVNYFFSQKMWVRSSFLFVGKCYFRYHCGCLASQHAASITEIPPTGTHHRLQCHTSAQYLVAHSSHPHSLPVAIENSCSVCHHPNAKYLCIVYAVTICIACSWL